jgi:hypothetical protein
MAWVQSSLCDPRPVPRVPRPPTRPPRSLSLSLSPLTSQLSHLNSHISLSIALSSLAAWVREGRIGYGVVHSSKLIGSTEGMTVCCTVSTSLHFNLQSAICNLQSAVCAAGRRLDEQLAFEEVLGIPRHIAPRQGGPDTAPVSSPCCPLFLAGVPPSVVLSLRLYACCVMSIVQYGRLPACLPFRGHPIC